MLTAEQIIAQARALSPAPITRLSYDTIAKLIRPEADRPPYHEWTEAEKEALLEADLPEEAEYCRTVGVNSLITTEDYADMVAMCVTLWQMWAAQQRWIEARRQEHADAPAHL